MVAREDLQHGLSVLVPSTREGPLHPRGDASLKLGTIQSRRRQCTWRPRQGNTKRPWVFGRRFKAELEERQTTMARWIPQIVAAASVLFAAFYLVEGRAYPLGTAARPGPGLYPLLVGLILLVTSLGTAWESWRERHRDEMQVEWPIGANLWRAIAVVAAAIGYILLLSYLGDLVIGFLVILVVLRIMGMTRWLHGAAAAAVMTIVFHVVFVMLLGVSLPQGILFG